MIQLANVGDTGTVSPGRGPAPALLRSAVLATTLSIVLAAFVGALLGWRVHAMITPSMARTAPVGSVVITSPVSIQDVHIGELISFHPPGRPDSTFVHRVVAIHHDGGTTLRTKGDLNGSTDGWVLKRSDLTGRARVVVPALGFLLQMLPLLLIGSLVILLVSSRWRRSRRGPLRMGLFSLLCSYLLWRFQPLTRVDTVSQTIMNGTGRATIVPTGALPMRIIASGGTHTDLVPGQLGAVVRDRLPRSGHFTFHAQVHLTGWWWLVVLVWIVPVVVSLRFERIPEDERIGQHRSMTSVTDR